MTAKNSPKYLIEYWDFCKAIELKYDIKVTPNSIYKVYRDWIIDFLGRDLEELRKLRPDFYGSIYNDIDWHVEKLKEEILALNINDDSPVQLKILFSAILKYHEIEEKIDLNDSKYIELLEFLGEINKEERGKGLEYYKHTKVKGFFQIVNAAQDYSLLQAIDQLFRSYNASLEMVLSKLYDHLDSFIQIHGHAINDKSQKTSVIIDNDKISVPEQYLYDLYTNYRDDIFKIYQPFFNSLELKTENLKIQFLKDWKTLLSFWLKNQDLIFKSPFREFRSWFPSETKLYTKATGNVTNKVTEKGVYVVIYEFLQKAFPNEVSDFEILNDKFSDKNLPSYLTKKSINEIDVDREMYYRIRDEVKKFLKVVWENNQD
jgi:hypothetical protein